MTVKHTSRTRRLLFLPSSSSSVVSAVTKLSATPSDPLALLILPRDVVTVLLLLSVTWNEHNLYYLLRLVPLKQGRRYCQSHQLLITVRLTRVLAGISTSRDALRNSTLTESERVHGVGWKLQDLHPTSGWSWKCLLCYESVNGILLTGTSYVQWSHSVLFIWSYIWKERSSLRS